MPARETLDQIDQTLAATAMDRLDPAPTPARRPPARPRTPRRRKGDIEKGVIEDLAAMPEALRKGTLAATALRLARELDASAPGGPLPGSLSERGTEGHARELRQHMTQLAEMAPGERKGDLTDEVRERRERRLAAAE